MIFLTRFDPDEIITEMRRRDGADGRADLLHPSRPVAAARRCHDGYRLIIAGRVKGSQHYWNKIQQTLERDGVGDRVIARIKYVPDEETEVYFKAADVLVLPYTRVFQSGVLFLGYSFGLPAIAADVGNLKEEIIEGQTGFVFRPKDLADLAAKVNKYFQSELFLNLETRRSEMKTYANERNSWNKVAAITTSVYSRL